MYAFKYFRSTIAINGNNCGPMMIHLNDQIHHSPDMQDNGAPGLPDMDDYFVISDRQQRQNLFAISLAERRRLSQYLHDIQCQQLTGISFLMQLTEQRAGEPAQDLRQEITRINGLIDQTMRQTRAMATLLITSAQEPGGPARALTLMAEAFQTLFDVSCTLQWDQEPINLSAVTEEVLVQVAQDAVDLAIRFCKARRIVINLQSTALSTCLRVEDNGNPERLGSIDYRASHQLLMSHAQIIGIDPQMERNENGWNVLTCTFPHANP